MNKEHLQTAGLIALMPAPIVFGLRALTTLLDAQGPPAWSLAAVGILSGLGMLMLLYANWKTPDHWRAIVAIVVALGGHYIVNPLWSTDLGGALVYLGTGFLISLRLRWAQLAGMVAGVGALLRSTESNAGHAFLLVGTTALAIAAWQASRFVPLYQEWRVQRAAVKSE